MYNLKFSTEDVSNKIAPANMWITDINVLIKKRNIKEVCSLFIKEPSTNKFHSDGLFSEEIFGQIASPTRMITYGYINLKTNILHPHYYKSLIEINRLYDGIMSGKEEAIFDPDLKDFVKLSNVKSILPQHVVGTGYSFFLEHLDKIELRTNNSFKRNFSINLVEQYKDIKIIDKWIVAPAGIRDYNVEDDKQQMEEMNNFYTSILISAFSLPSIKTEDKLWDSIRYNLQKKVYASYDYFFQILEGKGGFIQKKYTAKSIALGTRNVLTGTKICSSSTSGRRHNANETMVPLFQAAKMFLPLVTYYMNTIFFNPIFDPNSNSLFVIDKKYDFIKIDIDEEDKKKFTSREGIKDRVEAFRNLELRNLPFHLKKDKDTYYLFLVYDNGEEIHLLRNLKEFIIYYKQLKNKEPDISKIRPLTNSELLYICTEFATRDKFSQTTRYPMLGARNTYFSKTVVMSTEPDRPIVFINTLTGDSNENSPFWHYPILGNDYVDGVRIHPIWLKNLGGDHDGDTGNTVGAWSNNSTKEIHDYMYSKKYFLTPSGKLKLSVTGSNPVIDLTLKNMCYRTFTY